jgi:hypothetical protein
VSIQLLKWRLQECVLGLCSGWRHDVLQGQRVGGDKGWCSLLVCTCVTETQAGW